MKSLGGMTAPHVEWSPKEPREQSPEDDFKPAPVMAVSQGCTQWGGSPGDDCGGTHGGVGSRRSPVGLLLPSEWRTTEWAVTIPGRGQALVQGVRGR